MSHILKKAADEPLDSIKCSLFIPVTKTERLKTNHDSDLGMLCAYVHLEIGVYNPIICIGIRGLPPYKNPFYIDSFEFNLYREAVK